MTLTIIRNNKELSITVIRDKIEVKNIETKIYTGGNCYINIRMFDMNVHQDFDSAMQKLTPSTCTRYTFDLRNNPGGSLDEVASMLEYFVPPGSPSVIIKGKGFNQTIVAEGNSGNRITEKNIVILMNGGSASASEIFVGGIKDYGSHVTLIGQKTF
ncbi:MAG: S41 family peptidase [bacterium]